MRLLVLALLLVLCSLPAWAPLKQQADARDVSLPRANIAVLDTGGAIWQLQPNSNQFVRSGQPKVVGTLIGIDYRPSNGKLYALTDLGYLYAIDQPFGKLVAIPVSVLVPRFAGGFQSLLDFNPVLDAVRIIGSNDQNFAVVSSGGDLNVTATQTSIAYANGDVNAGIDPNIGAGAYTNNFAGAPFTIFYGIDYDLDVLVTIAPGANGSSATGGGQLQTIGSVRVGRQPINFNSVSDFDIYTTPSGQNIVIGINERTVYTIDLSQVGPYYPGQQQTVKANQATLPGNGSFIDLAVKFRN